MYEHENVKIGLRPVGCESAMGFMVALKLLQAFKLFKFEAEAYVFRFSRISWVKHFIGLYSMQISTNILFARDSRIFDVRMQCSPPGLCTASGTATFLEGTAHDSSYSVSMRSFINI